MRTFTKKYFTKILQAGDSKANWKVLRYAEVWLMYAEALNEIGKTALAQNFLNEVQWTRFNHAYKPVHYMNVFPIPLNQIQLINDAGIFPQNQWYD